jgi:hypothetical protein
MANITQVKQGLVVLQHDAVMLELLTRVIPEGATQTWPAGSPVAISSGLAVVFVAPTTAKLAGFALSEGHNLAAGQDAEVVLARSPVEVEVSFLGAAAADNVLAAADYGSKFDLLSSATLINSADPGWYLSDATADPALRITQFPPIRVPNSENSRTTAGDTNARVYAAPIPTKTHWNDT